MLCVIMKIFKKLINSCVTNILSENITDGDVGITGPKLFGKIAQKSDLDYSKPGSFYIFS